MSTKARKARLYVKDKQKESTFQSRLHFERPTLSEKLRMTSRSRSKENSNQARRERSSASVNQRTEHQLINAQRQKKRTKP